MVASYFNQTLLTLLSRWRIWKKIMDINNVFAGAHHVATDAAATIEKALHFEICPGGYWGTMLTVCDIGDVDAHMHYVYIEAGIAGQPTVYLALFDPGAIPAAIDALFELGMSGRPVFYNGAAQFKVESKQHLIEELCEIHYPDDDEDDLEGREAVKAICEGAVLIEPTKHRSVADAHKDILAELDKYDGDIAAYLAQQSS